MQKRILSSEHLEHRKTVLKLAYADQLSYARNEGFRTPDVALPFKLLAKELDTQRIWPREVITALSRR